MLNFTPDRRTAKYLDKKDDDASTAKEKGKIETMGLCITGTINELKVKQRDRVRKKCKSKNTTKYCIML